jgi:hypothetical protein
MRILIVEVEPKIATDLLIALGDAVTPCRRRFTANSHGFSATPKTSTRCYVISAYRTGRHDSLHRWREVGRKMPLQALIARDRWRDKIIRRASGTVSATRTVGPVRLDTKQQDATLDGRVLGLRPDHTALRRRHLASIEHKENLIKLMFTGRKRRAGHTELGRDDAAAFSPQRAVLKS